MNPRICVCCGEPMAEGGSNSLSRNPNVCASCSSMADGIGPDLLAEAPNQQGEAADRPQGGPTDGGALPWAFVKLTLGHV